MRLMDLLPQDAHGELVRQCPLRLVLADDLVRHCTELAFAEGDRLKSCCDLVRAPSQRFWVEWTDSARQQALLQIAGVRPRAATSIRRAGAYVEAATHGRSGLVRTLWSDSADRVFAAPMLAEFDLEEDIRSEPTASAFEGGHAGVSLPEEPCIDAMLAHVRFKFAPDGLARRRPESHSAAAQAEVLRTALGSSAFDLPMLFALFLLMAARDGAQQHRVSLDKLNRTRQLSGRQPLLDHIEVRSSLKGPVGSSEGAESGRLGRRLHHVRGHLARRGLTVYWRSPHMRGSARLGVVKSRTVALSFH